MALLGCEPLTVRATTLLASVVTSALQGKSGVRGLLAGKSAFPRWSLNSTTSSELYWTSASHKANTTNLKHKLIEGIQWQQLWNKVRRIKAKENLSAIADSKGNKAHLCAHMYVDLFFTFRLHQAPCSTAAEKPALRTKAYFSSCPFPSRNPICSLLSHFKPFENALLKGNSNQFKVPSVSQTLKIWYESKPTLTLSQPKGCCWPHTTLTAGPMSKFSKCSTFKPRSWSQIHCAVHSFR